jgi:hypothetical protein
VDRFLASAPGLSSFSSSFPLVEALAVVFWPLVAEVLGFLLELAPRHQESTVVGLLLASLLRLQCVRGQSVQRGVNGVCN